MLHCKQITGEAPAVREGRAAINNNGLRQHNGSATMQHIITVTPPRSEQWPHSAHPHTAQCARAKTRQTPVFSPIVPAAKNKTNNSFLATHKTKQNQQTNKIKFFSPSFFLSPYKYNIYTDNIEYYYIPSTLYSHLFSFNTLYIYIYTHSLYYIILHTLNYPLI